MGKQTPLYAKHVEAGARIVDFGGWDMPLHYGSQMEEHHAVRKHSGMFDVSHMTVVDLSGSGTAEFLRKLLANNIDKLKEPGKALYSCMLNAEGGVIDDLITYYLAPNRYRLIVNAATRENDLAWINAQADGYSVAVVERAELAMVAVQGPEARDIAAAIIEDEWRDAALALKPFYALEAGDKFIARTGYTGEDGWEIVMPAAEAAGFWQQCIDAGIQPCGLGARDTLRLEAGMNLYGTDMDATVSPLEAGLGWTIGWEPGERDFNGRGPLGEMRANTDKQKFAGLLLESKGVLRNHQRIVVEGLNDGEITSGGFSPTLGRSIAMARIPAGDYERAQVEVRGRLLDVRVVKLPFVRNGKIRIDV
ncbi:MAG: glycine cleavage system aminomethyltransferase GcvT [Gammaproteobacteria bacterium]|nr:MAG: glycine cleavage system aminomethyltransferase GcvT [Gammaproteobacteria bacterium]